MARQQIQNQMFKKFRKKHPNKKDVEIRKLIDKRISLVDVTDSSKPAHIEKALEKSANQMILVVDFDRFEKFGDKVQKMIKDGAINFHSDHHETDDKKTTGGSKTGATEFRSDTEHLATKTVSKGGLTSEMVLAFSDADSATFRQSLKKSLGLEKSDNKKEKIIGELFTYLAQFARGKKNPKATALFIKNSGDSLASMSSYAKKLADAVNLVTKGQGAINRKKDPSQKDADDARNELIKKGFPGLAKDIQKGKKTKFIMKHEKLQDKNVTDFGDKEKYYKKAGKYVVMSELSGAKQPSRYLGFTVPTNDPEIKKYFAMIRSWEGMGFFQMSLSPEAPKEVKDNINLVTIMKTVFEDVRKKFETRYNKWAFNIMSDEMGGHAGITNAGAFGLFGLMPKKMREEYKAIIPISKRVKKLSVMKKKATREEFLKKVPGIAKQLTRLKDLEEAKKEYAKNKVAVMKYFKQLMIEAVEKEIGKISKPKTANESLIDEIRKNSGMLNEDKYENEYPGMKLTAAEKKIVDDTSSKKTKKSPDEIKLKKLVKKSETDKSPELKNEIKKLRSKILDGIIK